MARRFDIDKINLDIHEVEPFTNEAYSGFVITWHSDIGFGEYTLYKTVGSAEWKADSEHMDNNEDKAFLRELLKLLAEKIDIVG